MKHTDFCCALILPLTLTFLTLKLLNLIHWPWYWVLSPLWIPSLILLTFLLCIGLVLLLTRSKPRAK